MVAGPFAVMGNVTEFDKGVEWLAGRPALFDQNVRVNVFETTIRLLGPLISAHMLATYVMPELSKGYNATPRGSPLLALAVDLGGRLLPAFTSSPSGIPYASLGLGMGVREDETAESNLAGAGTNILEYGMLSRLTGDPAPGCGFFPSHPGGEWGDAISGIGFGADSYYEYLLKGYLLFGDPSLGTATARISLARGRVYPTPAIQRHMRSGPWYADVNMVTGAKTQECFTSLQAFFPGQGGAGVPPRTPFPFAGLQAEVGDLAAANATHRAFYRSG
eukprot:gene4181-23214_t